MVRSLREVDVAMGGIFPRSCRFSLACNSGGSYRDVAVLCFIVIGLIAPNVFGQLFSSASHQWRTEIDRPTLERLKHEILLDEPRRAQAERLYKAHLDRFEAWIEQEKARVQEFEDERREVPYDDIEHNIVRGKRDVAIADALLAGTELDRQLFHEWRQLLLEEELEHDWPRFKRTWRREAWLRTRARFNDERVDLVQVIESLDLDWDDFLHEDGGNTLEVALNEYAEQLDHHLKRLNVILIENTRQRAREGLESTKILRDQNALMERAMAQDDFKVAWQDPETQRRLRQLSERQQAMSESRQQRRGEEMRVRNRIRQTNRFYRSWVLGLMPTEHAEAFLENWLHHAMPSLWRSHLGAAARYAQQVFALDDLTDDSRERIEQLMIEHRSRAIRLAEPIVRRTDEWKEVLMTTSITADRNPGREFEEKHLDPLYIRRHDLENEIVERITHLLNDEQRARLPAPRPFDYEAHIAEFRPH